MEITEKWKVLIEAAKNYYVDSIPTGLSDSEYDELETKALSEDGFSVRDYIFETYFPKGERYQNSYVEKFKKEKVEGSMLEAIRGYGKDYYFPLKYDGTSLAVYIDPSTGIPKRAVTCGNSSLGYGIDQTWKILGNGFLPRFPKGLVAVQCECLIDLDRIGADIEPERARQKTNGLMNSKLDDALEEVRNLLTLRAYRYWTSDTAPGLALKAQDYKSVVESFPVVRDPLDGHIKFAPADIYTLADLEKIPDAVESDHTHTSTGYFLNDGYVVYNKSGEVILGLKFAGAGAGDAVVKSTVKCVKWNNQVSKGKDSWSANVILDPPVNLHGVTVTKPSAGSVSKLVKKNITSGASVSVILANSTIPMVGDVFAPGNGDFSWPQCSCGYQMSANDIYGSLLKCGNPMCTERLGRMRKYIKGLSDVHTDLDLNKFLVLDRFKWETTDISIDTLLGYVEGNDSDGYHKYLSGYMKTDLQMRNLELVWLASWTVLRETYLALCS